MGFLKFVGGVCSVFLYIYNGLLMVAGIIIMIKGIYALMNAREAQTYLMGRLLGIDELYRELGMSYILPASIMIIIAYFGWSAAGSKVSSLVIYAALTIMLMSANTYGISQLNSNKFSLYSYLNRIFISEELGRLSGVAYPEYGIQVAMLGSSVFLLFLRYMEKREEEKIVNNARRLVILRGLLQDQQRLITEPNPA